LDLALNIRPRRRVQFGADKNLIPKRKPVELHAAIPLLVYVDKPFIVTRLDEKTPLPLWLKSRTGQTHLMIYRPSTAGLALPVLALAGRP
jgi:hypothetical protein